MVRRMAPNPKVAAPDRSALRTHSSPLHLAGLPQVVLMFEIMSFISSILANSSARDVCQRLQIASPIAVLSAVLSSMHPCVSKSIFPATVVVVVVPSVVVETLISVVAATVYL